MKGTARKMSQNFNYSNGIVGKWKSYPVEVIKQKDYDSITPSSTTIYALSVGDHEPLKLVLKDSVIGMMSPSGDVSEFNNPTPYYIPKKMVEKPKSKNKYKEKHSEDECPVRVSVEYNVEEIADLDLLTLSKPIDEYLERAMHTVAYESVLFADG